MANRYGKILVVDDDEDVLLAVSLLLKNHFSTVHTEKNPGKIGTLLRNETYDVVLLDMNFNRDTTSGSEGFYWLNKILQIDPSVVVILITAYGDVEMAVRAIKEGATDFVLKPWQNEKLIATISAALKLRQARNKAEQFRTQRQQLNADIDQNFQEIIGNSPAMLRVYEMIQKVSLTDANVLILGENGTGKELVARAIHRQSLRFDKVFISLDMGAISESLFESELFGHVRGAFTDAKEDRIGRFEVASGGTLFLDEIGNLPLSLQAKLLQVIQNREVIRVGSHKQRPIDIHLICATNMPIYEMISENHFRQDLLYRINTVEIQLPSLHERKEDIPLLIDRFLAMFVKKYHKKVKAVGPATMNKLQKYRWPGNVRELQHAIECAVIMSDTTILRPQDFLLSSRETRAEGLYFDDLSLNTVEKVVIQKALHKNEGNISRAARELGLTRAALYRRMEKYGI